MSSARAGGSVAMVEIKFVRADLPQTHVKPIQEALTTLHKRCVVANKDNKKKSKSAQRTDFAKALKLSLDDSFGPHWHVIVGEKIGFACKKRQHTMGVWKIDGTMVVIWQSPGIESDVPAATSAPSPTATETDSVADSSEAAAAIRVLEPATIEEDSEVGRVVAALREELARRPDEETDMQSLAQDVRERLTTAFGTIWHVIAGAEFVIEAAEDRRNHVVVVMGKTRLVCFQHEQFKGGREIDFEKIINALPYLLLAFMCFAFMTFNTVCKEEFPDPHSPFRAMLHRKFCGGHISENTLQYYGGGALVVFFMGRRTYRTTDRKSVV